MDDPIVGEWVSAKFEPYFLRLGWFVHSWGLIERQLDIFVAVAWHRCGGKDLPKAVYPRTQLGRKLAFLKQAVVDLPALADFAERISIIVEQCENQTEFRHLITHGTAHSLDADKAELNLLAIDRIGSIRNIAATIPNDTFNAQCITATQVGDFALQLSDDLLRMSATIEAASRSAS